MATESTASAEPSWRADRARIAALTRAIRAGERLPDDPDLADAQRNLRYKRTAEYIVKVVGQAPPLSDDQLSRLAELLRPARAGGAR